MFQKILIISLSAGIAFGGLGCKTTDKKNKKDDTPPVKTIRNQNGDTSFQSFVGILNQAVARRDKKKLETMMLPDFGYSLPNGEGIQGAFAYWDKQNLWEPLAATLEAGFAPAGPYMVAPPAFAADGEAYQGYRVGLRRVGGSWRFAYFIGN